MGIDYDTGTTFYERFELCIRPNELFPRGLTVEVIPWQGKCFNIIKITSYIPADSEEIKDIVRHYRLNQLTQEQQKFIRDVTAKHYVRYRNFMLLTEDMFSLEEEASKYSLYMNDLGNEYIYTSK